MMKESELLQQTCQQQQERKDHLVLIVVEKHAEWMDVTLTSRVFRHFKMAVKYVASSSSESVQLTRKATIRPDMTFEEALQISCKILVLPGGKFAVSQLMENKKFNTMLKRHVEQQPHSLVAAMGASATQILPSFGYVDRLGPTCYPLNDTGVVVREYQNRMWTAPGLGSATELALALGEYFYGHDRAKAVADSIGYEDTSCSTVSPNPLAQQTPKDATNRSKQPLTEDNDSSVRQVFWNFAWKKLEHLGWKFDLNESTGRCVFLPPDGFEDRILGSICFDSVSSVLEYLWKHPETASSKEVITLISDRLGQKKRRTSTRINNKTKNERKDEAEQDLFLHVVWTRLKSLGWTLSETNTFVAPSDHHEFKELKSREETMKYLLTDPALRMEHNVLAIVDLYQNCQRYRSMDEAFGHKSAAEIELETKKRMPALAWNLWKRDTSKVS